MAKHITHHDAQVKNNKKDILAKEEIDSYMQTTGNEGVSHNHSEWVNHIGENNHTPLTEKDKDIQRNLDREVKNKNILESRG